MRTAILVATLLGAAGAAYGADPQLVLNGSRGSVIVRNQISMVDSPSVPPGERVCISPNGERVDVLEAITTEGAVWLRVRVATGPCALTEGWIGGQSTLAQ